MDDFHWMQYAIQEANDALARREVPVGCIFLLPKSKSKDGKDYIVAKGSNETNETGDATRHAEIVAIEKLYRGSFYLFETYGELLENCDVYVTCEPCIMCANALKEVGVSRVIFGCRNDKFGGMGSILSSDMNVVEGLMKDEAVELFNKFFKRSNPQSKVALLNSE